MNLRRRRIRITTSLIIAVALVGFLVTSLFEHPEDPNVAAEPRPAAKTRETAIQPKAAAPDRPNLGVGAQAGQEWDRNSLKMKFCWCPAGSFLMGSPVDERGRDEKNENQVQVELTKGFWLGMHEVTQNEWRSVMESHPWREKTGVKEGVMYPAAYVSWNEATEFCRALTIRERQSGRLPNNWEFALPTEAQWEYACRAGSRTQFEFGDDESQLTRHAWFSDNSFKVAEEYAHEVGRKLGNAWGLHDMHGNVWEWCKDGFSERLPGGRDPKVGVLGGSRICRGGCWYDPSTNCRSSNRLHSHPGRRGYFVGFRIAIIQL